MLLIQTEPRDGETERKTGSFQGTGGQEIT